MFEFVLFLIGAAVVLAVPASIFRHLKQKAEQAALFASLEERGRQQSLPEKTKAPRGSVHARSAPAHAPSVLSTWSAAIDALNRRAVTLAEPLQLDNANRRFHEPLTHYVPERLAELKKALNAGAPIESVKLALDSVQLVVDELETLIEQRQDGVLRAALGDADALANACYAPVANFAHGKGIPLTSLIPATHLGAFEMSTWTGFIPTSIAPIFLPEDFFERAVWWTAIAHEIAHDFLVSVTGLEGRLRAELGYRPFHQAYLPVDFARGFTDAEVQRVVGAWFEELFCDVFGTLMCGPAYVQTMIELFAAKSDPREVLAVGVDPDGRGYDCHPPSHLRVTAGCLVLSRAGFHRDAEKLRKAWAKKNRFESLVGEGAEEELELFLLFPTPDGYVRVAIEPFETLVVLLATRLYSGALSSLDGVGLRDIPGLDYGPHEHEEAARARAALLEGRVPRVRDVRAVIAGAVMASTDRRGSEKSVLELARRAIPAFGTFEVRPDAYSAREAGGALSFDADVVRDALVLREIFQRPGGRKERR